MTRSPTTALETLTGRGAASIFWSGERGGDAPGAAAEACFRLVFGLGRSLLEDEEIDAGGDEDEDQEPAQDGFGDAHRPPPYISEQKDAFRRWDI